MRGTPGASAGQNPVPFNLIARRVHSDRPERIACSSSRAPRDMHRAVTIGMSDATGAQLRQAARLLVDSARQAWDDNGPRLAASLAFYGVFSFFPVLLLSVTTLGFVLGDGPGSRANLLD